MCTFVSPTVRYVVLWLSVGYVGAAGIVAVGITWFAIELLSLQDMCCTQTHSAQADKVWLLLLCCCCCAPG
jgi:hypothetical protein